MLTISLGFRGSGSSFQSILAALDELDGELQVGIPAHRRAPSRVKGSIEMWKLAWILEYGNPSNKLFGAPAPIPARPVLTAMWSRNAVSYLRGAKLHAAKVRTGKATTAQAMEALGRRITADIRRAYASRPDPELAAFTLRYRKGDTPLSHTKALARAWVAVWSGSNKHTLERMGRQLDRIIRQMESVKTPGAIAPAPLVPMSNVPRAGGLPVGPSRSTPKPWRHA